MICVLWTFEHNVIKLSGNIGKIRCFQKTSYFFCKKHLTKLHKNVAKPLFIYTFKEGNTMSYAEKLKEILYDTISEVDREKSNYILNPCTDFIRKRKIGFEDVLKFIISIQNDSIKRELMSYYNFSLAMPTDAALNQQRAKVLPKAFESVFKKFNHHIHAEYFYHGYRLMACDGSSLAIAKNMNDSETYCYNKKEGYNLLHLNAMYDLLNNLYVDAVIQPVHKKNEKSAFCEMVDRYGSEKKSKAIFVADRGLASFNTYAHIQEQKMKYVIRTKDLKTTGKIAGVEFPDSNEFDVVHKFLLTYGRKRGDTEHKYINRHTKFDFLREDIPYPITVRFLRFKIPGTDTYECIATNLTEEFTVDQLCEIYRLRWGVETAFRNIKYAIGLEKFHSKKREFVEQEIWAKLILYNFCGAISTFLKSERLKDRTETRYQYQMNFSTIICLCKFFIARNPSISAFNLEQIVLKTLLPVRRGRSFPRIKSPHKPVSFCYRNS